MLGSLIVFVMACMPPHSPQQLAVDLASKTVALVEADNTEVPNRPYCSGVWVGSHEILTANHCVDDDVIGDPIAYLVEEDLAGQSDSTTATPHFGVLVATDEVHDLALVLVSDAPRHGVAELSRLRLERGVPVHSMGAPLGLFYSYSSGEIAAVRHIPAMSDEETLMDYVQATAAISPGNSGGGLFDDDGRLVGITQGTYVRGQLLNLFIHRDHLAEFLSHWQ